MSHRAAQRVSKSLRSIALAAARDAAKNASARCADASAGERAIRRTTATALLGLIEGSSLRPVGSGTAPYPAALLCEVGRAYAQAVSVTVSEWARKKPKGLFYTPLWVADRLAARVKRFAPDASSALDPACGAGALLLGWLDRQPDSECIGWDTDPEALELADALIHLFARQRGFEVRLDLHHRDLFAAGSDEAPADVMLMNPPYSTLLDGSALEYAQSVPDPVWAREPNLFELCLHRVLELAGDGTVGVILPDVVRMQPQYGRLRSALVADGRVRHVEQLTFGTFPEAAVQPILLVAGGRREGGGRFEAVSQSGRVRAHDSRSLAGDPACRWSVDDPRLAAVWDLSSRGARPLGEIARCHEGIHTGNIRAKLFTRDPEAEDARSMLKGADVVPFGFRFANRYVRYHPRHIDRSSGEYASLRDPEIFRGPKLLSRQTSDRLIVCMDRGQYVTDNTLHTIRLRPDAGVPLEWLAVFLNSALATVLYRFLSGEADRPLPQIKLTLLRKLPIRPPAAGSDEVRSMFSRAEEAVADRGLDSGMIAELNGLVFDSYAIPESDRDWILAKAARRHRTRGLSPSPGS